MRKKLTKRLFRLSPYLAFTLVCICIGVLSYHIYKYYEHTNTYSQDVERFIGLQRRDITRLIFSPLETNVVTSRLQSLGRMPVILKRESQINEKLFSASPESKGTWIPYEGLKPPPINYGALFQVKNKRDNTSNNPENKKKPDQNTSSTDEATASVLAEVEYKDKLIANQVFEDIVETCRDKCSTYDEYNNVMWRYFFADVDRKNLAIGKIYIASDKNLFAFPYGNIDPFEFEGRPWWIGAEENNTHGKNDIFDDLKQYNANATILKGAGVSTVYTDIEETHQITDLSRTIWFKFNKYDRDYIFCVDIRLQPMPINFLNNIRFSLIPLPILLLLLPVLFHYSTSKRSLAVGDSFSRIYKMQRLNKQKVDFNAGMPKVFEFSSTFSIVNSEENRVTKSAAWQLSLPITGANVGAGGEAQSTVSDRSSKLIEMTVRRPFDLSLKTTNLKSVELWRVCRPDDTDVTLGVIEVLWQNNRSANEITFSQVYWDANTSASYTDILKQLRKHLHTNEQNSFLSDQSSLPEKEADIISALKKNLDYVNDFATKFEAYSNRVLLFDNSVPLLKAIYSNEACTIFATCSIEFLYNLKRQGEIQEILKPKPNVVRYIIDGETRKFTDFFISLDDESKKFITSLQGLRIIEYKPSQETIYLNRDFCLISFGSDRCVLYTDMSDAQAQKGWISWRTVDIDYYDAIKEYIESGDVQKRTISDYLGVD